MNKIIAILTAAISCASIHAGQVILEALPSPSSNVLGYRFYAATNNGPFNLVASDGLTVTLPNVDLRQTLKFYATAFNATNESDPSITVILVPTNSPPPILVLMPPTVSATNVVVGQQVTITATIRNNGGAPLTLVDGSLTLLVPGGTLSDGPYVNLVPITSPITINSGLSTTISGTWTATTPLGGWNAYMVVKQDTGTWTASAFTPISVSAPSTVIQPPAGLRVTPVSTSRLDIGWDSQAWTVLVERSRDGRSFAQVASLPGDSFFPDTNLRRDTRYFYRARSQNVADISGYSGVVSGKTLRR
jgi:conserved repeat domain